MPKNISGDTPVELTDEHVQILHVRGVIDEVIAERGYYSDLDRHRLVTPLWDRQGKARGNQYRPDNPGDGSKYLRDKGSGQFLDCPPRSREALGDPSVPLYVVEGPIKADAIASAGGCAVGIFGVFGFRGKNARGGKAAVQDFEHIALNGRTIYISPDSDVRSKAQIQRAMVRLENAIRSVCSGVVIRRVMLPTTDPGAKQGPDDFLAAGHTLADFDNHLTAHWPTDTDTEFTDALMAEAVADEVMGDRFVWCKALGWLGWDGMRYRSVSEESVREAVREYVIRRHHEAVEKGRVEAMTKLTALHSASRLTAVTKLSAALVEVDPLDFDADADLLNCRNGVLDLRTGELMPHDPDRLMTKLAPTNYKAGFRHADWDAALEAVPDEEVRDWLHVRMGQAISGHTPDDDVAVILKGGGENGKSTLVGPLSKVLGDYHVTLSDRVLLASWQAHPTELMDLMGARMAVLEETPEAAHLDTQRLKKIQGTEKITARRIAKDPVTFSATHSLFIATNHDPVVSETDHGTWRRLRKVDFPVRFRKPGEAIEDTKNDRRGDPGLRPRVIAGRDGQHEAILAWLVAGAMKWYAADQIMPTPPAKVEKATSDWRKQTDLIHGIWDELIIFDGDRHVMVAELHTAVSDWLKRKGYKPMTDRTLSQRFSDHPTTKSHRVIRGTAKKSGKLSNRPQTSDDDDRDPIPAAYKAWKGIRFRTLAEGVAEEAENDLENEKVTAGTDQLDSSREARNITTNESIGYSGYLPGQGTSSADSDSDSDRLLAWLQDHPNSYGMKWVAKCLGLSVEVVESLAADLVAAGEATVSVEGLSRCIQARKLRANR